MYSFYFEVEASSVNFSLVYMKAAGFFPSSYSWMFYWGKKKFLEASYFYLESSYFYLGRDYMFAKTSVNTTFYWIEWKDVSITFHRWRESLEHHRHELYSCFSFMAIWISHPSNFNSNILFPLKLLFSHSGLRMHSCFNLLLKM